jgi:hypothetical protein
LSGRAAELVRSAAEGFRHVRRYRYIGPKQIAARVLPEQAGFPIHSSDDVRAWIRSSRQELHSGCVIATFVVDAAGVLRVADRRSEHVACAGGKPVRSAGEMTFAVGRGVEIAGVSNQSTGYCPEPESWSSVAAALISAGLKSPPDFDRKCVFRTCTACGRINIVKGGSFECGVCAAQLPFAYNCQQTDAESGIGADGGHDSFL